MLRRARKLIGCLVALIAASSVPTAAFGEGLTGQAPKAGVTQGDLSGFVVVGPPGKKGDRVPGAPISVTISNQALGFQLGNKMLLPSWWAGEYTLRVTAQDTDGNQTSRDVKVNYKPTKAPLTSGVNGKVLLPAIARNFLDANNKPPITTGALKTNAGKVLDCPVEVYATLSADSDIPLMVNGVRVAPGDALKPLGMFNFQATDGRLELPLSVAETGQTGKAKLLISLNAPDTPVVELDVQAWTPLVQVTAPSWSARQALDPYQVTASVPSSALCRLVASTPSGATAVTGAASQASSTSSNLFAQPECRLVWNTVPEGLALAVSGSSALLKGRLWQAGDQPLTYSLFLKSGSTDVLVQEGSQSIAVAPAQGGINYAPNKQLSTVYQAVQKIDLAFPQSVGPAADVRYDAEAARTSSNAGKIGVHVQWTSLPNGLTADRLSAAPHVWGALSDFGAQSLAWSATIISPAGAAIPLNSGTVPLDAILPPTPTITFDPVATPVGTRIPISPDGGRIGDAMVSGYNADMIVTIARNGQQMSSERFDGSANGTVRNIRTRLDAVAATAWEEASYDVTATYADLPSVSATAQIRAITLPPDSIRPVVQVDQQSVLDTGSLTVNATILDSYAPRSAYDAATMGRWKVRLFQRTSNIINTPITDWQEASAGSASFDINLPNSGGQTVVIGAEAQLLSPVDGFDRTVQSVRNVAISVLRGGAIESSLSTTKLAGIAPFTAVFTTAAVDRLDSTAVGNVIWEISTDNGATWDSAPNDARLKTRFTRTFAAGSYLVRARVFNRYSNADQVTEAVQVTSFEVPTMAVTGPENTFVGYPASFRADVTKDGQPVPADKLVIQWSMDNGKTWVDGAADLVLSKSVATRVSMKTRARLTTAPMDAPEAWVTKAKLTSFVDIKPPLIRMSGPALAEVGKEVTYSVLLDPPYRNMNVAVEGAWVLPHGEAQGSQAVFVPTDADTAQGSFNIAYEAWYTGINEPASRGRVVRNVRTWKYIWPEFKLVARRSANYAPATVTYRIETPGFSGKLDSPVYSWSIPSGGKITDESRSTSRTVTFNDVGSYEVQVQITDSRGNTMTVSDIAALPEPPPFDMTVSQRVSNTYNRAPLTVTLRPTVTGGHPYDRIQGYAFKVDGNDVMSSTSNGTVILEAGSHTVEVVGTSRYGKTVTASIPIQVAVNQAPKCTLQTREGVSGWSYYAQCLDQDGRVMSYNWTLDGEASSSHGERISVGKSGRTSAPVVTVVGVDDAGDLSEPASSTKF